MARYNATSVTNAGRFNVSPVTTSRYGVQLAAPTAAKVIDAEENTTGQKLSDILSSSLALSDKLHAVFSDADKNAVAVQGNNPLQINSLLDVLFNKKALEANYGNANVGSRIKALIDMNYAQRIAPMFAGKVWEPVTNTVQSLGEGLDVVANPVKALLATPNTGLFSGGDNAYFTDYDTAKAVYTNYANGNCAAVTDGNGKEIGYRVLGPDGKYKTYSKKGLDVLQTIVTSGRTANIADMTTLERFKSAIGIGDHGRINYDLNTGTVMGDILGEIMIDPLNWIDFGTQAAESAMKASVKNAVKGMAKDTAAETAEVLAKVGEEKIAAGVFQILKDKKVVVASKDNLVQSVLQNFLKDATKDNLTHSYAVNNLKDAINAFLVTNKELDLTDVQVSDLVSRIGLASQNRMTLTAMRSLEGAQTASNKVIAELTKATLDPIGVYPVSKLVKAKTGTTARIKVAKYITDKLEGLTKPYQNDFGNVTTLSWEDLADNSAKFNTHILDALTPVERTQYLTDGYVKMFLPQLNVDKVQLQHILQDTHLEANDKLEALNEYITRAYRGKGSIDDVIAVEQNIADTVEDAAPFLDHIEYLKSVKEQMGLLTAKADCRSNVAYDIHNIMLDDTTGFLEEDQEPLMQFYHKAAAYESDVPHTKMTENVLNTLDSLQRIHGVDSKAMAQYISECATEGVNIGMQNLNVLNRAAAVNKDVPGFVEFIQQYSKQYQDLYVRFNNELKQSLFNVNPMQELTTHEVQVWLNTRQYRKLPAYDALLKLTDDFDAKCMEFGDTLALDETLKNPYLKSVKSTADIVKVADERAGTFVTDATNRARKVAKTIGLSEDTTKTVQHVVTEGTTVNFSVILNIPEIKKVINLPTNSANSYDEIIDWWSNILNTQSDRTFADVLQGYSPNRVMDIISDFNNIDPYDAVEYRAVYTKFYTFLSTWKRAAYAAKMTNDAIALDKACIAVEKYAPEEIVKSSTMLTAWEDLDVFMQGQTYTLMQFLSPDSPYSKFLSGVQSGELGKTLKALDQVLTPADQNLLNDAQMTAYLQASDALQGMINTTDNYSKLIYTLQSNCGLSQKEFDAVMEALTINRNTSASTLFDTDAAIRRIMDHATSYKNQTFESTEAFNLEHIGFKNHDRLNELRVLNGMTPFADDVAESHIALDDALNNLVAWEQLVTKDPKFGTLYAGKRKVFLDMEATNATIYAASNQLHSIALVEVDDDGKIVKHISLALNPKTNEIHTNSDVLKKLGIDEQEYLDRLTDKANTLCDSEADMIQHAMDYIFTDADYTADNCVFITHNGKAYDLPLLRSKAFAEDVRLKGTRFDKNHQPLPTESFKDLPTLDTLEQLRIADGQKNFTTVQLANIEYALRDYARKASDDGLNNIFKVMMPNEMDILAGLETVLKGFDPVAYDEYKNLKNDVMIFLSDIRDANKQLRSEPIYNKVFKFDEGRLWKDFVLEHAYDNISGTAEAERYLKLQSLNSSTVTSVQGEIPKYAVRHFLLTPGIERWFKASATADRVDAGGLSTFEAIQFNNIAKKLDQYRHNVYDYDFTCDFTDEFKTVVDHFTNNVPEFKILQQLDTKTDGADLYAIAQFIWSKYHGADTSATAASKEIQFMDLLQNDLGMDEGSAYGVTRFLKSYNKVTDPAQTNYAHWFNATDSYNGYRAIDMNVKMQRAQLTDILAYTDAQGAVSSSWRTTMKIMEPIYKYANEIKDYSPFKLQSFERFDRNLMVEMVKSQIKHVTTELSLPEMLSNLANHSNGFLRIQRSMLDPDDYKKFISLYNTDEAKALGLYLFDDPKVDGYVWLTLDKSAHVTVSVADEEGKLANARFFINGKYAEPIERPAFDFTARTRLFLDEGAIHNKNKIVTPGPGLTDAVKALDQLTDGASAGTTYRMMTKDRFDELYSEMPAGVRDHFDYDTFTKTSAFKRICFDNSDYSMCTDPFSAKLFDSFSYTAEYLGAETRYIQANFSDLTRIDSRCELGQAILADPRQSAKWFQQHDCFVGVILEARKSDGKAIIKSYDLKDPAQLAEAVSKGAQFMDYQEYSTAYDVINNKLWSESKWKAWNAAVRVYKIGYLSLNLGTVMRNFIDTVLKNSAETKTGLKMGQYYYEAADRLYWFDKYAAQLAQLEISGDTLAEKAFFDGVPNMNYDEYTLLKKLMNVEVFGGEAHTFTKLSTDYQDQMLKTWYSEGSISDAVRAKYQLERTCGNTINTMLAPMSYVERIARYAEYFALNEQGKTTSEIAAIINRTHYDYTAKSALEHTMERFIPFYTFQTRNLNHWIDIIDRNPHVLVMLRDILGPTWDLDSYDPDQIEHDKALQYHLMSGNIKLSDNYYLNTSLSMMDALQRVLAYPKTIEGSLFSPVEAVVAAALQESSDNSYEAGHKLLSEWLQGTFGLKMTDQQIQDKYGEWSKNYYELTQYKASQGFMPELLSELKTWAMVPFIGTQINRFLRTETFDDDTNDIERLLYMLGVGNVKKQYEYNSTEHYIAQKDQYRTWLKSLGYTEDTSAMQLDQLKALYQQYRGSAMHESEGSKIYTLLQADDQNIYLYSRLKAAMGYADKSLKELPEDVKETLYAAMANEVDVTPYIPMLQNVGVMTALWKSLASKYEVDVTHWNEIPAEKLNAMYHDIARSVIETSEISSMLQDSKYRYAYSVAKKQLGYGTLKLSQLPCDSLSIIKAYMLGHSNMQNSRRQPQSHYYNYQNRVYHRMTYALQPNDIFNNVHYLKGGTPTYTSTQAARYYVQSHYDAHPRNIYSGQYTSNGKMRQRLRMLPITPKSLQYRIQDHFWYMH